jgi:hypothetical protein
VPTRPSDWRTGSKDRRQRRVRSQPKGDITAVAEVAQRRHAPTQCPPRRHPCPLDQCVIVDTGDLFLQRPVTVKAQVLVTIDEARQQRCRPQVHDRHRLGHHDASRHDRLSIHQHGRTLEDPQAIEHARWLEREHPRTVIP